MRVMFKKRNGAKTTTNILEVIQAAVVKEERAIYCECLDKDNSAVKFVAKENYPDAIFIKVIHDLMTDGTYNFSNWEAYCQYYVEENGETGWMRL